MYFSKSNLIVIVQYFGPILATAKTVITVQHSRNVLMKLHSGYTSITDELENVCQMITSPTMSHDNAGGAASVGGAGKASASTSKNTSDDRDQHADTDSHAHMSAAAIAAMVERKHLRECEEDDYMTYSKLMHDRYGAEDDDDEAAVAAIDAEYAEDYALAEGAFDLPPHRRAALRRDAAVELPVTPSKSMAGDAVTIGGVQQPPPYAQLTAHSADLATLSATAMIGSERHSAHGNFLIPSLSEPTPRQLYHSCASVAPMADQPRTVLRHQTSSTDTEEYTLHPYRVIKQNSNDTNASLTEETPTVSNESLNRASGFGVPPQRPPPPAVLLVARELSLGAVVTAATSAVVIAMPPPLVGTGAGGRVMLNEQSSSTSTEAEEQRRIVLPRISSHLVQDEIAQMSSTMLGSDDAAGAAAAAEQGGAGRKGSAGRGFTEDEAEKAVDASFSETMC